MKNKNGYFGAFGGAYVPETLTPLLKEVESVYLKIKDTPEFKKELAYYFKEYVGRETPLYFAERLTKKLGGAKIYLKREDLCHTGAHKINNSIGQALLAKKMNKKRIIAETGAGQHGVATATVCAMFGLECEIYMGEEDIARQELNVFRMKLLGAKVNSVTSGTKTLKDAMNECMRDWVTNVDDTFYILGTVGGPHPFPQIVRDFQSVIGREARKQILEKEGKLPDALFACVGGGSNSIGLFSGFLKDKSVAMYGIEAGGEGVKKGKHAARFSGGREGVFQGALTYVLQDKDGQIKETHSVSAGLDYAGIGPEHCYLMETKRVKYVNATDKETLKAFEVLSHTEGIIPALESAHAVAYALKVVPKMKKSDVVIINLSGRGDKDVYQAMKFLGDK